MAYKQIKKYGFRDQLEKGDPEKVIYGADFDAEFEAIEGALEGIFGEDGTVDPDDPAFEQVVFQNRPEPQRVVSKMTFERFGDAALVIQNTGIWANSDQAYVRYDTPNVEWRIKPTLTVEGDLHVKDNVFIYKDLTVNGNTDLNGDLNINGGSIIIDGSSSSGAIDKGTVQGEVTTWDATAKKWTPDSTLTIDSSKNATFKGGTVTVGDKTTGQYTSFNNGSGVEQRMPTGTENVYAYRIMLNGQPVLVLNGNGNYSAPNSSISAKSASFSGAVNAGSFVKTGGTSSQLLCADGSVADKGSVGGDTDLSGYYTKTESDGKYEPKFTKKTGFNKDFGTAAGTVSQGNHTHAYSSLTGLPTLYTGDDAVKTSGNQTIGGAKTFSSNVSAPDFVATSDAALKENVVTASSDVISKLRGVEFTWKDSGEKSSGVIAQELEEVLPHLVHSDGTHKKVSYNGLLAYLIEEVKALRAEVEAMK